MTVAYWCVLFGALLPIVWTSIAKAGGPRKMSMTEGNRAPRDFLGTLEGHQKRANWAQLNAFEAFPAFAAAVIISHLAGAAQPTIDMLALIWVAARIAHGICYLADWASLRSTVYFVGMGCVIGLFVVAA